MGASANMTTASPVRVSVGMPVYNGGKHLPEAIRSFLAQDFANFELIISDNASTDRTAEIARDFAARDDRIRYVRQPKNIGAPANFTFVLDEARGEFFQWAAHDDIWRPFWLERATATLGSEPKIGFAFPSFAIKDQNIGIESRFDPGVFAFVEADDPRERLLTFLALHFLSQKCNLVYSLFRTDLLRSAVKQQGIEDDGALASLVLQNTPGRIVGDYPFVKRWGLIRNRLRGFLPPSRRRRLLLREALDANTKVLEELFPEEKATIREINKAYQPGYFPRNYAVIDVRPLLSSPVDR